MEASFDEQHPSAKHLEEIQFEGSALIKSTDPHSCFNCGKTTHWIDINFEGALCSPECERKAWEDYANALQDYGADVYGV